MNIAAFLFMLGVNFSSGIFSAYLKSFGATELIIGIGAASLYITRGTSSIFLDKFAKKISFRNIFIIAFLGSALSSLMFIIPQNALIIAVLRSLQGIFSGLYWVLINIYSVELGKNAFNKFKNLSLVTVSLNVGGFLGSILSGKIASFYSPTLSFQLGALILLAGALICLKLPNVERNQTSSHSENKHMAPREKLIISFSVFSSCINGFIGLGVPIYILQTGGSYNEIGILTGMSILSVALITYFAPLFKKHFAYKTIILTDYILVTSILFFILNFKSFYIICTLYSLAIGISALERNLWFSILQEHSDNYTKTVGILRGTTDYFGFILNIFYGFVIQIFGVFTITRSIAILASVFWIIIRFAKPLSFLSRKHAIHISGITQYHHMLHRLNE